MKGKYLRRIGGLILTALLLTGIAFVSPSDVQAQGRRRVVIVRPIRPFGFGFGRWGYPYGWGYGPYGPYGPYGSYYGRYVFDNSNDAANQAYKDGYKTGRDDGKKAKSFSPERSHYFKESGFGNFAEDYRTGFSRGYQEGYQAGQNERASRERAG